MSEIYKVKTFLQIYDAMKRYLIGENSELNNFNEGSRISVILEAVSVVLSQTQNDFYQALKNAIPVAIYNGFGFDRLPGNKSAGALEFTRSSPATEDYPIASGTSILLNGIRFETIVSGVISAGNTSSGQIDAVCSIEGVDGNISGGAIDTSLGQGSFVNQPDGVEACTNPIAFTGGSNIESDEQRVARFRTYINSLARSTVEGLKAGALSVSGVKSVTVVELYPSAGWVTLYVDDGTGTVSQELKNEIIKVIDGDPNDFENYPGYRAAGIQVQIVAPKVQYITVNAEIKILTSSLSDDAYLRNSVKSAIEQYINKLTLGSEVILTEMITAAQNAHEDIYDITISSPTNNVSIDNDKVARTSSVTITSIRVVE